MNDTTLVPAPDRWAESFFSTGFKDRRIAELDDDLAAVRTARRNLMRSLNRGSRV